MNLQDKKVILKSHISKKNVQKFMLTSDIYKDWVWFIVHEGAFSYIMDKTPGIAQKGDIVICPPGIRFARTVTKCLSFHFLHLEFSDASGIVPGTIRVKNQSRLFSDLDSLDTDGSAFDNILTELQYKNNVIIDIWFLYCMTVRQTRQLQDDYINGILKRIRLCVFDKVSLSALAADSGLSYAQFKNRFKKSQGVTPMEYITDLRIEKAKSLLAETSLPMEKVADVCGYENQFYFSTMFKKKTGVSPSIFRDMHRT